MVFYVYLPPQTNANDLRYSWVPFINENYSSTPSVEFSLAFTHLTSNGTAILGIEGLRYPTNENQIEAVRIIEKFIQYKLGEKYSLQVTKKDSGCVVANEVFVSLKEAKIPSAVMSKLTALQMPINIHDAFAKDLYSDGCVVNNVFIHSTPQALSTSNRLYSDERCILSFEGDSTATFVTPLLHDFVECIKPITCPCVRIYRHETPYYNSRTVEVVAPDDVLSNPEFWDELVIPALNERWDALQVIMNSPPPIDQQAELFLRLSVESLEARILEIKDKQEYQKTMISSWLSSIDGARETIITYDREIARLQDQIAATYNSVPMFTKEVAEIRCLPEVTNVKFNLETSTMEVSVEALPCSTDAVSIAEPAPIIGPYIISLKLNPLGFKIQNTGNPMGRWAHPHCEQNETPCHGDFTDVFILLKEKKFSAALVQIIHGFLKSYNEEDSWGLHILMWSPKYGFDVLRELGTLDRWDLYDYQEVYYNLYNEDIPQYEETCEVCGEPMYECCCSFCPRCGENMEYCDCERCYLCGELISDCQCERCSSCDRLLEDCQCERCSSCGELISDCLCDRCSYCGELIEECTCERCSYCNEVVDMCMCEICEDCGNVLDECTCEERN